jgi:hypothetical protein
MILHFTTVLLQLIDEVTHPVHLHSFYTLSCEVYYKSIDLCWTVISDKLASYKLASEVHYAILYRGYLVAFLSLFYYAILYRGYLVAFLSIFYIAIILLYALCQGAI